jgi:splicing factor 3A subunit 1
MFSRVDIFAVEYNHIDWHDFTVIATIEFTNADDGINLPPPTSLADLEYASLEQKRLMINYDPDTRRLEAMPEDNPYVCTETPTNVPPSRTTTTASTPPHHYIGPTASPTSTARSRYGNLTTKIQ